MSRQVDPNAKNLSAEDKAYLVQRGSLSPSTMSIEEQRKLVDPEQNTLSLDERANTGDVNTANLSIDELEALLAEKRAEAEAVDPKKLMSNESGTAADGDDEDDEDDEPLEAPYDQYTNAQLRAEIDRRNETREDEDKLSLSGTKPELVERLTEDDDEDEDNEE